MPGREGEGFEHQSSLSQFSKAGGGADINAATYDIIPKQNGPGYAVKNCKENDARRPIIVGNLII